SKRTERIWPLTGEMYYAATLTLTITHQVVTMTNTLAAFLQFDFDRTTVGLSEGGHLEHIAQGCTTDMSFDYFSIERCQPVFVYFKATSTRQICGRYILQIIQGRFIFSFRQALH